MEAEAGEAFGSADCAGWAVLHARNGELQFIPDTYVLIDERLELGADLCNEPERGCGSMIGNRSKEAREVVSIKYSTHGTDEGAEHPGRGRWTREFLTGAKSIPWQMADNFLSPHQQK